MCFEPEFSIEGEATQFAGECTGIAVQRLVISDEMEAVDEEIVAHLTRNAILLRFCKIRMNCFVVSNEFFERVEVYDTQLTFLFHIRLMKLPLVQ